MEIIRGLKRYGDYSSVGSVLDPPYGKVYRRKIWIEGKMLMLHGYGVRSTKPKLGENHREKQVF